MDLIKWLLKRNFESIIKESDRKSRQTSSSGCNQIFGENEKNNTLPSSVKRALDGAKE